MATAAKTAATVQPTVDAQQDQNVQEVIEQSNTALGYQNTIKKMIATGCKRVNSVRIKNVNVTVKDNYTMISFTIGTPIMGSVSDDEGNFSRGLTNTIYTSLYAITGAFKENEEIGWMANTLLEKPEALNLILNGSTIDILQQEVEAGQEVTNPFSTNEDQAPRVYDHDIIINHVIGYHLGGTGKKMADRLADKLLGF